MQGFRKINANEQSSGRVINRKPFLLWILIVTSSERSIDSVVIMRANRVGKIPAL